MEKAIKLFADSAPGSEKLTIREKNYSVFDEKNNMDCEYVEKVIMPSLTPCFPAKPSGEAVIVIPGGGYRRQVITKEGLKIAEWLTNQGITAFILKHRMPGDGHENCLDVPLQDAQRAVRLIRSRSEQYKIRKDKIGVMGFSAGSHVAATLATSFDKEAYVAVDEIDKIDARPDFAALLYPVISMHSFERVKDNLPEHARKQNAIIEKYPTDKLISAKTPPTFIAGADDDMTTPSEHCVNFYLGLRKAGISSELHLFKTGGHGFGLGQGRGNVDQWPALFERWFSLQIR